MQLKLTFVGIALAAASQLVQVTTAAPVVEVGTKHGYGVEEAN